MGVLRNKYHVLLFFILIVLIWTCSLVRAQRVYIDITSPYLKKIPIAIPYLASPSGTFEDRIMGKRLSVIMSRDLTFQGYFSVLNPDLYGGSPNTDWTKFRVDYVILGDLTRTGDKLTVNLRLFDLATGKQLVGIRYIGNVKDLRLIGHKFCDQVVRAITGQPGISLSQIAMVVQRGKGKDVYICDFDGQDLRRETFDNSIVVSPKISPNGRLLVYTSYRNGRPCLYIKNLITHQVKLICSYRGVNIAPAWSPDGKKLLVTLSKDGNPDLYIIDLNGKILKRLTYGPGINVSGCWSPDGSKIAFVSNREGNPQIYIMNLKDGSIRRLTYQGSYNTDPSWSPKGDEIAYSGLVNGSFQIFTIPVSGGTPQQLTDIGNNHCPSWSPDGRQIVFSCSVNNSNPVLYVMYLNGAHRRLLLKIKNASITCPNWGPDKR